MKTCKGCIHFSVCCLRHFEGRRCERFKQGWVSVEDELPDQHEYERVLVAATFDKDGTYGVPMVAELRGDKWHVSDPYGGIGISGLHMTVTHWMPLPAPPEVKKRDLVEVVRCKDCEHYEAHGNGKAGLCKNKKCKRIRYENDFCSHGERREP